MTATPGEVAKETAAAGGATAGAEAWLAKALARFESDTGLLVCCGGNGTNRITLGPEKIIQS